MLSIDLNKRVYLSGSLGMQTVSKLVAPLGNLVKDNSSLIINLSKVTAADSAALALLLHARQVAKKHGHTLQIESCPNSLQSLLPLYGLNDLLPCTPKELE